MHLSSRVDSTTNINTYKKHIPKFSNGLSYTGLWALEALNIIFWKHMMVGAGGRVFHC